MITLMTNWPGKIGVALLLMACISCQGPSNKEEASTGSSGVATEDPESGVVTSTYTTETGKTFTVTSEPFSASLAVVSAETEGFEFDEVHEFGALDPVDTISLADLDQDGFQELYIITQSAGSGSYQSIFGVASNKDRSTSSVHLPELERGELLEGFMGHNRFVLQKDELVEIYPVYERGDSNISPSGGERSIRYSLIKGEASWILKPVNIEDVEPEK